MGNFAMTRRNACPNTTAPPPVSYDLEPAWRHHRDQIVPNLIGYGLVKDALVSKRLAIEFEALQLDTGRRRLKPNGHGTEVRVAGLGTHRGKFLVDVLNKKWRLNWGWKNL